MQIIQNRIYDFEATDQNPDHNKAFLFKSN